MMTNTSRTRQYDFFKLIVTIGLLLAFLCLFLWTPSQSPDRAPETTPHSTLASVTASFTPLPPTSTPSPIPLLTETATPRSTETPATLPTAIDSSATPSEETSAEVADCEAISRSQLQVGSTAVINRRLNFRSSPGIGKNLILTNVPGTRVEVVGGPACTHYRNGGAYLWWKIELPDGQIGWSAEASAFGTFYFMEPIKR